MGEFFPGHIPAQPVSGAGYSVVPHSGRPISTEMGGPHDMGGPCLIVFLWVILSYGFSLSNRIKEVFKFNTKNT